MEEYQGAKSIISSITDLKGGVVAALSKLIAVTYFPDISGTFLFTPSSRFL